MAEENGAATDLENGAGTPPAAGTGEGGTPPAEGGNWWDTFSDDNQQLVAKKSWENPEQALTAYSNLEKMVGDGNAISIPGADAEADVWGEFYNKLGRPETSDQYDFSSEIPEGLTANEASDKWFREKAHELGLTQNQASKMRDDFNQYQAEAVKADMEGRIAAYEKEQTALKAEWGEAYDKELNIAQKAFKEFGGLEDAELGEAIKAMEESDKLGYLKTMKVFNKIGRAMMGEQVIEGLSKNAGGFDAPMTPQQAQARISEIQADKAYLDPNSSRHKALQEEMTRMFEYAHPEQK